MKALKVFVNAVKETPGLFFAPVQGMFEAAARAQRTMSGSVIIRAQTRDSASPSNGRIVLPREAYARKQKSKKKNGKTVRR